MALGEDGRLLGSPRAFLPSQVHLNQTLSLNLQCPEPGALISRQGLLCLWELQGSLAQGVFLLHAFPGKDHVDFGQPEPHTVLFHEPGRFSVWVGGRGKVYLFNFPEGKNASVRTVSLGDCPPLFLPLPCPWF